MSQKRFYWLKLMKDFFHQKRIKKLRRIAGGDTYVIIYLKLMLLSINNNGVIIYESVEDTFEQELAYDIDEDVENVQILIAFLIANGLCKVQDKEYHMVEVPHLVGAEAASTQRSRKSRERKKLMIEANQLKIEYHDEIDNESLNQLIQNYKMLHCNTSAISLQLTATKSNTEKEIEKEIEILDDEDEDELQKAIKIIQNNGVEADELLTEFMQFITLGDKTLIKNRFIYAETLKSKILNNDRKTLSNLKTYLKNDYIVNQIRNQKS
jgi:predicted phage replisome organizer